MSGVRVPRTRNLPGSRSGVAALELAILAPALLAVLGGLADFGLAYNRLAQLDQAVESGAAFAFAAQQEVGVSGTISAASVQAVVRASLILFPAPTVTVTGPEPGCTQTNSASSPPVTAVTGGTYGQPCPNGNPVGTYVIIGIQYAFQPIMPFYSLLSPTTLSATATVRLY